MLTKIPIIVNIQSQNMASVKLYLSDKVDKDTNKSEIYIRFSGGRTTTKRIKSGFLVDHKRWDNSNSKSDYLISRMSLITYRTGLKKLFKTVGFTRVVTCLNSKTNEIEHTSLDQSVSAHVALRVFLSVVVNMGYNSEAIYSMSGHKVNSKEISRYYSIEDTTQIECVNGLDLRISPMKPVFSIINENPNSSLFVGDRERSVDLFGSLKRV